MPSIKSLLNMQKGDEAVANVDDLLEQAGIENGSLIISIDFNRTRFKEKSEVVTWLKGFFIHADNIDTTDKGFKAMVLDEPQFDATTIVKLTIARGVTARVGRLIIDTLDGAFLSLMADSVKLTDDGKVDAKATPPRVIELAKVVKGVHPSFGEVELTADHLKSFVENFEKRVHKKDIPIDFDHTPGSAAAWIVDVFLSENGKTLLGAVKWTPKGLDAISSKEYRYFSPEFVLDYQHQGTGKFHGPTLLGGAITNIPFLDLKPVVALSQSKESETMADTIALTEHSRLIDLKDGQITKLTERAVLAETAKSEAEVKLTASEEKLTKVKAATELMARKVTFEKMLSDGKACEAQREGYLENDTDKFALNAAKALNTDGAGGTKTVVPDSEITLSAQDKEICKMMNIKEEDFIAANRDILTA